MITNKKILNEIVAIEASNLHNGFIINGLNYWPAIRVRLTAGLINQRRPRQIPRFNFKKELKGFIASIISIKFKYNKSDILFVTHDNYKVLVEGRTYDRVMEGHKNECIQNGKTFLELNFANGKITYSDLNKSERNIQFQLFLIKVYCYLVSIFKKNRHIEQKLEIISTKLTKVFPSFKLESLQMLQHLLYLRLLTSFFINLIEKLGVSTIYQSNYYDPEGLAINSAANHLEIISYCAQHGCQSKSHPAFSQWTNVPINGYEMLPDIFLCWDRDSANTVSEWASKINHHEVKVTGYKWPQLWRDGTIEYSRKKYLQKLSYDKLNILFTMQPSIEISPMINEMINQFPDEVNWWMRLHPRQIGSQEHSDLQQLYKNSKNIFVVEATNEPLPAIMINIDLHLTGFSSCIYEAMLFKVPTILINPMGKDYYSEAIRSGQAELCLNPVGLKAIIDRSILSKTKATKIF